MAPRAAMCFSILNAMFLFNVLALGVSLRLAAASPDGRTVISPQLGPFPVAVTHVELKTNRDDPLAPNNGTKRRIMLSIIRPQTHSFDLALPVYIPYMSARTAEIMRKQEPGGIPLSAISALDLHALQVEYCAHNASLSPPVADAPLLLFQPGYQENRFEYQILLGSIASSGYTVISMDITYEAPIVEFTDGSTVLNNTGVSDEGLNPTDTLPVRAADASSVLDALESGDLVVPGLEELKGMKLKAGVFGHSLGGAAAALAASLDERFTAVVNWDGQFFPSQANLTVSAPTLLFQREQPLQYQADSWKLEWENLLKGEKAWIAVNGTQHLSFSDLPLVIEAEGLKKGNEETFEALGGTIGVMRMREIVWRYSVAFFDQVLKGRNSGMFKRSSVEFPDVWLVKDSVGLD